MGDKNVEDYTINDIQMYSMRLSRRPGRGGNYSTSSMSSRLTHIRRLFRQLAFEGCDVLNWQAIAVPHSQEHRLIYLKRDEYITLLHGVNTNTFEGLRLRACIEVLMSTGCRVSELLGMKMSNINLRRNEVIIRGAKNSGTSVVYLNQRSVYWLKKYLVERKKYWKGKDILWISKQHGLARLDDKSLWFQINALKKRVHLTKDFSAHTLRHTFATNLLMNGANIREVQELLRHKSIQSTMVYTHISNNDVKAAHRKYLKV